MNKTIKIATIVTCHNRSKKTIRSLSSLVLALSYYNKNSNNNIHLELFITDDGCTDNTFVEIAKYISSRIPVTVVKGDGNLFWAGGMRLAWKTSLARKWDFFLLLNDDTELCQNVFFELFSTDDFCIKNYNKRGLYSGMTSSNPDDNRVTYGGFVWENQAKATKRLLNATGKVQNCDMTNANILLVHNSVVETIGIFCTAYSHSLADFDFSIIAKQHGFPVVVTANICGFCEDDHLSKTEYLKKICNLSLSERKKHFSHPIYSTQDYETFIRRTAPSRIILVKIGRWINLYAPKLYLLLHLLREY